MDSPYSLVKENDRFFILQNDVCVETPKGNKVSTVNESFALELLKAFENGETYNDGTSVLAYHYSFLDFGEHARETVKTIQISGDPYLHLGIEAPVPIAFAAYLEENLPEHLASLPLHRVFAYITLWTCTDSIALPFLVEDTITDSANIEEDMKAFYQELREFNLERYDYDEEDANEVTDELIPFIETFIKYYSYEEV